MKQTLPSDSPVIRVVSSEKLDAVSAFASARLKSGPGNYDKWEQLHKSVKSVLAQHGTVSWDPDPLPDFYFSGDWFHENSDGFGICSSKPIQKDLLEKLPQVLAAHDKDAVLEMGGIEQPIEGLKVFATSLEVLVAWEGLDQNACEQRLRDLGIELD